MTSKEAYKIGYDIGYNGEPICHLDDSPVWKFSVKPEFDMRKAAIDGWGDGARKRVEERLSREIRNGFIVLAIIGAIIIILIACSR